MNLIISYIARGIVLIISIVLYVYLFSAIIPKFIMRLSCKGDTTKDRGLKKFIYPNGRCVVYEPEISVRRFVSKYALYTEDGFKYLICKTNSKVKNISYDIYVFDNQNKLRDIIAISETLKKAGYTKAVALPPETSYIRFVLRRADSEYFSNQIIAEYSPKRYWICAVVVGLATLVEAILVYSFAGDLLTKALRLRITINSVGGMIFMSLIIAAITGGLTVLAYRRYCKKVINR